MRNVVAFFFGPSAEENKLVEDVEQLKALLAKNPPEIALPFEERQTDDQEKQAVQKREADRNNYIHSLELLGDCHVFLKTKYSSLEAKDSSLLQLKDKLKNLKKNSRDVTVTDLVDKVIAFAEKNSSRPTSYKETEIPNDDDNSIQL